MLCHHSRATEVSDELHLYTNKDTFVYGKMYDLSKTFDFCMLCNVLNLLFAFCVTALYNGIYKQVDRIIAVCLVHGGVEPQFFSERLYRQVCALQPPMPELKEIAEYDFREKLEKVSNFILSWM